MKYNVFKMVLLGVGLLTSVWAGAQQFETDLQMSNDDAVYWYRICNASAGMQAYAMTDCSALDAICQVQLLATENANEKSQWKLTAGTDGLVVFTNRATGLQLNGASVAVGEHNATQLTAEESQGFTLTELGDDAFSLKSLEDDGVNRCLALAERDAEALTYPDADVSTSIIGWKFIPVETVLTGIRAAGAKDAVIRVANKRVYVSGCPQWQLFNAQGVEMPRTTALAAGAYLVKMGKEVRKVMVF